ncbi:MAG: pantoate--beta-alanine ligase, partial [Planctomycetota bacterium]
PQPPIPNSQLLTPTPNSPVLHLTSIPKTRAHRKTIDAPVALVPTMGALHDGHLQLIAAARKLTDEVWVSVFVNPTQFGPHEDFNKYPRPIEDDLAKCEAAGARVVFNPPPQAMYPPGGLDTQIDVPAISGEFEGENRPGHFHGVCRVCLKLFNICQPTFACFGQKDYQQLRIIESLVADLNLGLAIQRVPTVREPDGLAMSSRNRYLDDKQRRHALGLSKALQLARHLIDVEGETDPAVIEAAMAKTIAAHHLTLDYAAIRHPDTLAPLDTIDRPIVALVAGRLGSVRLLDNALIG